VRFTGRIQTFVWASALTVSVAGVMLRLPPVKLMV
jgi:hypothetical protein